MRFPRPGPGNLALWCRRSTDMPLCLCPFVRSNEILPFPRIRGPLPSFLRPSPTVKLHLFVLPLRGYLERIYLERIISRPILSKFIFDAGRWLRRSHGKRVWYTNSTIYVLKTGPQGKRIYNVVTYIYRCGEDLNYTDRCFRGWVFVPRADFQSVLHAVSPSIFTSISSLANASLLYPSRLTDYVKRGSTGGLASHPSRRFNPRRVGECTDTPTTNPTNLSRSVHHPSL